MAVGPIHYLGEFCRIPELYDLDVELILERTVPTLHFFAFDAETVGDHTHTGCGHGGGGDHGVE